MPRRSTIFDGHIMGGSFASGDRVVAGRWFDSPLGGFADVMWCRADGSRVLLAPRPDVRDFVARHYAFDELTVLDVRVERTAPHRIEVAAGPVRMILDVFPRGAPSHLLRLRPKLLRTRPAWLRLEDRVLRPLVAPLFGAASVRTYGTTLAGDREWYAIHDFRSADARARIEGRDAGPVAACPPARFGFSEFPAGPALVRVTSRFEAAA